MVEEAHRFGKKVAAHANSPDGILRALEAGVDSIEHGHGADRHSLEQVRKLGRVLVPTLSVMDGLLDAAPPGAPMDRLAAMLEKVDTSARTARELGVRVAVGSDISCAGHHGENAKELVALAKRGYSSLEVLRGATLGGAELMGWEDQVGSLEPGRYADLIAVRGDPIEDLSVLLDIPWVMKGGVVVKPQREPSQFRG